MWDHRAVFCCGFLLPREWSEQQSSAGSGAAGRSPGCPTEHGDLTAAQPWWAEVALLQAGGSLSHGTPIPRPYTQGSGAPSERGCSCSQMHYCPLMAPGSSAYTSYKGLLWILLWGSSFFPALPSQHPAVSGQSLVQGEREKQKLPKCVRPGPASSPGSGWNQSQLLY